MENMTKRPLSATRTISLIGIILMLFMLFAICGYPHVIDATSAVFTFGGTFFLLLGTFGKDYLKFIPDSLLTLVSPPLEPSPRYADICRFGSRYIVATATITTFFYFIAMLQNLSDPQSLGMGLSIAILPTLYALIIAEVFFALLYKAYSGEGEIDSTPPLSNKTIAIVLIVFSLIFIVFLLTLISFLPAGIGE